MAMSLSLLIEAAVDRVTIVEILFSVGPRVLNADSPAIQGKAYWAIVRAVPSIRLRTFPSLLM